MDQFQVKFIFAENYGHAAVGWLVVVTVIVVMVVLRPLGVRTIVFRYLGMVMVAAGGKKQEGASEKKGKKKGGDSFHKCIMEGGEENDKSCWRRGNLKTFVLQEATGRQGIGPEAGQKTGHSSEEEDSERDPKKGGVVKIDFEDNPGLVL